jgi:hypothetical protein
MVAILKFGLPTVASSGVFKYLKERKAGHYLLLFEMTDKRNPFTPTYFFHCILQMVILNSSCAHLLWTFSANSFSSEKVYDTVQVVEQSTGKRIYSTNHAPWYQV